MVLALECLRAEEPDGMRVDAARAVLWRGDRDARDLERATMRIWHGGHRLLRARLALALRVLLRADAGDFGALECDGCDARESLTYLSSRAAWCNECRMWTEAIAPVRPLWGAARPHGGAR
jgi:hypothetical protein